LLGKMGGFAVSTWTCPGCRCGKPLTLGRTKIDGATQVEKWCSRCWSTWRTIQRPGKPPMIIQGLALLALQAAENGGSG
jgi:hypothetical protein